MGCFNKMRNIHLQLIPSLIVLLITFSCTVQAVSYECGKAIEEVEKLVCSYPSISKLDDELNKLYQKVLSKAEETQKQRLITEQKHWLKHTRNPCKGETCLKLAYWSRQAELATFFEPKPPIYKHEREKADAIKQVLASAQLSPVEYNSDKRFCGQFFDDLKQMKGIHFVDPLVQTQSYEDPALDKFKQNCGTKPPLHFGYTCLPHVMDNVESTKDAIDNCDVGFGLPPFKLYELPPLKQHGKKRYIFYSDYSYGPMSDEAKMPEFGGGTSSGFDQIDPEKCTDVDGARADTGDYASIVKYRNQYYFMVWTSSTLLDRTENTHHGG